MGQVLKEAQDLDIPATHRHQPRWLPGRPGDLVANIDKLVNGKSLFGVGAGNVRTSLGSVVIDDAPALTLWPTSSA